MSLVSLPNILGGPSTFTYGSEQAPVISIGQKIIERGGGDDDNSEGLHDGRGSTTPKSPRSMLPEN